MYAQSKFINVFKSEVPGDVSQNGRIYQGQDNNLVVFESNCEKGRYAYLTDKNGKKITRGKRIAAGNILECVNSGVALKFGSIEFKRI